MAPSEPMTDTTIKHIEQIDPYQGPHEIPGIRFRPARAALGVSAWGMNVLEIDAGCTAYPEHDHSADGQEEVYFVVRGAATLVVDGAEHALATGTFARVPAASRRKLLPGPEGVTLLALGATPGQPFKPTIA